MKPIRTSTKGTHTPGPWDVSGSFLTNDGQKAVMTIGEDRVRVALVDRHAPAKRGQGYKVECPTRDANARLITAAPDLLAALLDAKHALYGDGPANPKMEAAIRKATNGS